MNVSLASDGPLDVAATLARYRLWGDDPANRVEDDVFRRVLRRDGALVPYEVRWSGPIEDGGNCFTAVRMRPRARSSAPGPDTVTPKFDSSSWTMAALDPSPEVAAGARGPSGRLATGGGPRGSMGSISPISASSKRRSD